MNDRHRAMGDASATATLFSKILQADSEGHVQQMLKGKNKESYLPPNIPAEQVDKLPYFPGVYYFHDRKGKVIYVGKARNLQQRVKSHFSNNDKGRRKQDFLREICSISHQVCGSELMALILESAEIHRLWPTFNRSLKRFEHVYGLYSFEDQNGYIRLGIEKKRKYLQPLYTFNMLQQGYVLLRKLAKEFMLDEGLCYIDKQKEITTEDPVSYNQRVLEAIKTLQLQLPTYALLGNGKSAREQSCLLIEQGRFYGMGYLPQSYNVSDINELKLSLTQYPDNDYVRGLVYQYAEKNPHLRCDLEV
jgi:DNA polymerase-3 subunit epsilon